MPDLSGLIVVFYVALGGVIGALLILPVAVAAIWIGGLMAWAWVLPVLGMMIGAAVGAVYLAR